MLTPLTLVATLVVARVNCGVGGKMSDSNSDLCKVPDSDLSKISDSDSLT